MGKLLWKPMSERIAEANITRFIDFVNRKHRLSIKHYDEIYSWSVENIPDFWAAVWEFVPIMYSRNFDTVVDDITRFPGARWFPGSKLNYAENLLRRRDSHTAIIFRGEDKKHTRMTYRELYYAVARLAKSLREMGIKPGDRIVGYMPNMPETTIAMLAAASVGAVWASCATDIGPQAAVDRLGQIEPAVLFTVDGYYYKGKLFNTLANAAEVARGIPSLKRSIIVHYGGDDVAASQVPNAVRWADFLVREDKPELTFEQLPADHPLFVMFSSGTTGKPKCMAQPTGGVLTEQLKELILHVDLKPDDTIFYLTTCSWMMWNWLMASLGVGATVVLYDGNPNYPDAEAMWKLIETEKVTVFGTSASYINFMKSEKIAPKGKYNLSSLKAICQTGSVLSAEGFEYVYQAIKDNIHFNSLSGGTDINGCFAMGVPTLPVYAGELQRWCLGMKMGCWDEKGRPLVDQMGELVCRAPAPSMPLYFWNDPKNERYRDAYFSYYSGVWRHGDYVMMHSDTGGITFFGRSDALLKPSGIRIGTAEIYNLVEKIEGIADSLAIGQDWKGDQRILLFVKLAEGIKLTEELKDRISSTLRTKASPRHVPARILAVPDIPYTLNMKKVEVSVTNIIHGRSVTNRDALANPESLDYYEQIAVELQKE